MKERRFALSLGASVFLHAALLLAVWYAPRLFERPPAPSRTISLDMLGIVKDRAVVEQRKQTPTPPVEQAPPPPPKPKPKIPPVSTESAVKITEEKREKPAPIAPTTPPLEREQTDEAEIEAQTRKQLDLTEKELMAAYVATIGKRIQSKLIYPEQARREESKGSARVSFTIQADGTLKPESLVVTESSGHELLDRKALKAVEFAAPFPSPPKKELSVTITVSFAIDR